jgi:diacylglycerol kinase
MNDTLGVLRAFFRGFVDASRGVVTALKTQRNMRVHALALAGVVIMGIVFHIAPWEWCAVILSCGLVWMAELVNTAIEWLADRVSTEREEAIRKVKDVAAGAVLMASIAAAAVGVVIFLPKLLWH